MSNTPLTAFAGSAIAPFRLGGRLPATDGRRSAVARVTMADADVASKKPKKKAKITFATDMKGKPIWKLRTATPEDAENTEGLFPSLPNGMVGAYMDKETGASVLCEATIKGTKEGEGFKQRIFGAALVYVGQEVVSCDYDDPEAKTEWSKFGELISVKVDPEMVDADAVKNTLTLGALKKMKGEGVDTVRASVAKDQSNMLDYYKTIGFKKGDEIGDCVEMVANLRTLNPDPLKKVE